MLDGAVHGCASMNPGKNRYADYPGALDLEVDVCIIGAGAGGSSAACAVAEAGKSVVVLEEGRHWNPGEFSPKSTWAFKNLYAGRGTRATRGNAIIPMPGGRGVGGSTLINSAICFRTPDVVLADWRENRGCVHFTEEWMAACFDRIWATIGVGINPPEVQRLNNIIFKKGVEALGLKGDWMARSAPGCVGCGTCQQGCNSGGKNSIDRTFLTEALQSGRVGVYADCRVDGVETDGGRVVAVTGRTIAPPDYTDAGTFRVRAKQFIVSGGPIGSPRFLLKNGLSAGPVGENLHIHPTSGVLGRFDEEIRPWTGVSQGYYADCWDEGFLLQVFNMPPDQYYVGIQLPQDVLLEAVKNLRYLGSAGIVVHDEDSTGSVTEDALLYSLGDGDRKKLLAGMRQAARVFFAAGAKKVIVGIRGVGWIESEADIDRLVTDSIPAYNIGLYASHPMGTCRMGGPGAVVDAGGKVYGWENLYVADASVFPTSLGVNPQVTVMAIGLTVGREVGRA